MKTKIISDLEVILPKLPAYVCLANECVCKPIHELTDMQIRELGQGWTEALIAKAREKRDNRSMKTR